MNPTPPSSGEDSIPARDRKGEIQLTDILSDSKYAKAKYVFPPIYSVKGKNVYDIVNGREGRYALKSWQNTVAKICLCFRRQLKKRKC